MGSLQFTKEDTGMEGLFVLNPFYAEDERGFFLKGFEKDIFRTFGLENEVNEWFVSGSKKNVVRGLHFQTRNPQVKIVSALEGSVLDIAVDLRRDSTTYGKYESCELSGENHKMFYIPKGFAHGFCVLSDWAVVSYVCIGKYYSEYDAGIVWDDPDLGIEWPFANNADAILSDRDRGLARFADFDCTNPF